MAFTAKDGQQFSNLPHLKRHELRMGLNDKSSKPPSLSLNRNSDDSNDTDSGKDITQDPQAMEAIETLKSLGYTIEEVTTAFEEDQSNEDQSQSNDSSSMSLMPPSLS